VSPWRDAWRRLRRRPAALAGATIAALVLLAAVAAPLLAPADPLAIPDPVHLQLRAPAPPHLLGTDAFGRDILSRLLYGARVSLAVGLASACLGVVIGGLVGLAAGLGGPLADGALMRTVDVLLALPRLLLLMAVFAMWEGLPLWGVILLIAGTGWLETSRLVRTHVRSLRSSDFVAASTALGAGRRRLAAHLAPHVAATLIVAAALDVGGVMVLEASLAFLGLGLRPPAPSWGNMILEGRSLVLTAPWVALAPGAALTLTVVAFNLLGDGLRDALDPRAPS
jgi:peptide/nickel transport system permease protein